MLRVRTIQDVDDFTGAPDDPSDYSETVTSLWEKGVGKPGWCFVAEDDSGRVGRVGFLVKPTTLDPRWLGTLPTHELLIYGLDLMWEADVVSVGRQLLVAAATTLSGEVPDLLEARVSREGRSGAEARCNVLAACGFDLFIEKQGFSWVDNGLPISVPARLTFRTVEEAGRDPYMAVMARCGDGSLDRNDHYYWEGCGPVNWAAQMMGYLDERDIAMWLIAYAGEDPIGYVAVASSDDWGSTIIHTGVVPEHRGNGYVDDLLAAGTAAAQRAGISTMLCDVDVLNQPMIGAMIRAGHRTDLRPWHVWAFRTSLSSLVDMN